MKVHFVGIGGSGISGVASLAKNLGYIVSGCNLEAHTAYTDDLERNNIEVIEGHNVSHIKDADLVAASPSVFFQTPELTEISEAKKQNKLVTWQNFLGKYLQKEKTVVCVAGTHGKSTTSAMLALLLERAGLDPLAMIGAQVHEWGSNSRAGKGIIFVTEADEFYDNFLNYIPDTIILNNIEYDHPDYFKNEEQYFQSFVRLINNLTGTKTLIYNPEDPGIKKLFSINSFENVNKVPYDNVTFDLGIPGRHNILNSRGVITFARLHNISDDLIKQSLVSFSGIGRRLEFLGERNKVLVYDDYAHHPTAIAATIEAIKQKHPSQKIIAIVEPHTFSRTKALLHLYNNAFKDANFVIITPIYKSRDSEDFGITGNNIVAVSENKNIEYIDNFEEIVLKVKEIAHANDIILVMGAGKSYELSRQILNSL